MSDSVLLIGSGGREHCLAWKLAQSERVKEVLVAPGNAGTHASGKISNVDINVKDHGGVATWCKERDIKLVVVGPEDPLANGLSSDLTKAGIKCFGPCKEGAQIEASKEFAKLFMDKYQIPTARWKSFSDASEAKNHIMSAPYDALVVKASGLAAGKGVIVAKSSIEAAEAVDTLKQDISSASETIVVEELLSGEEVSVLGFSDGTHVSVMPPAQDHKRLLDNDEGPNTGGMGAYCPCPLLSEKDLQFVKENVMKRAIDGMRDSNTPYIGVLYAGLMLTKDGPKVLEFNCRLGDPETQVILPLLKSDLYSVMLSCVDGTLDKANIEWATEKSAVGVVLVSGGYPGSYPKGKPISGLEKVKNQIVFHAGTSNQSDAIVTSGGRVLAVVSVEDSLQKATSSALQGSSLLNFDGVFYRKDIAQKALKKTQRGGLTYKSSGVDIESADDLIRQIKILTKETMRPEVYGGIGGFGGIFELKGYSNPYLIGKVGSIGEKLKVAQEHKEFEMAGYDLVAVTVNEIVCAGGEPQFFLDTFTCGKLDVAVAAKVVAGIAKGCKDSNCALIGGETAEMPGMYLDGDFDLTAFGRGVVEKPLFLPQTSSIACGDIAIGLLSSNLNFQGFKVMRTLMKKFSLTLNNSAATLGTTFAEALLQPSQIYVSTLLPLIRKGVIKAAAYVNKGGLMRSVGKILPKDARLVLDSKKWDIPPVFKWIEKHGALNNDALLRNFSLGIDVLLVVSKNAVEEVLGLLESLGKKAAAVGRIQLRAESQASVDLLKVNVNVLHEKRKIAVLTSSKGIALHHLISHTHNPQNFSRAEIAVVVTETDKEFFTTAKSCDIPVKEFISDESNVGDMELLLKSFNIDIIIVDGYSGKLPGADKWKNRILSIYPSLLPAFQCKNVYGEVLSLGARITGCTVHAIEDEGMGRIVEQAALNVELKDTEETLREKVEHLMHSILPKALEHEAVRVYTEDFPNAEVKPFTDFTIPYDCQQQSELEEEIETIMRSTARPGFKDIEVFDLKGSGYTSTYLISGTDGVGTKLKIAQACNKHDTIGIDLVAMCVNDILCHGAEPLFFMAAYESGRLNSKTVLEAVSGIAEGCKQANCSLIGADLNVLPDIYFNSNQCIQNFDNYDVVGYAEGALCELPMLPRFNDIEEGDSVIGISSSGVHSNGFSLVRKLIEVRNFRYQDPFPLDPTQTIGEVLLTPTKIYVQSLLPLMKKGLIKAAAHITGGGLTENIPRILPQFVRSLDWSKVVLDGSSWELPKVLQWIASEGGLSEEEMLRTFNCGLGMVLIVDPDNVEKILLALKESGETASVVGNVKLKREGDQAVEVHNFSLQKQPLERRRKKVGVLISGSGTNLQALIDYTQNPCNCSSAEIVLVLSNVPDVEGLKRAERAGITTQVLSHKNFKKRVEFDMAVNGILEEHGVEIVCLAGFMRIVSKEFVQLWAGRLLNVHPAILPAFKGMNAHKLVLEAGAKVTGCTVHFVEAEVDAGAIIEQAAVNVDPTDDEKSLQEKVKVLEHRIFPTALELLASGRVARGPDAKIVWNY